VQVFDNRLARIRTNFRHGFFAASAKKDSRRGIREGLVAWGFGELFLSFNDADADQQ